MVVDESNTPVVYGSEVELGRKAWTAYIGLAFVAMFLFFIAAPLAWTSSSGSTAIGVLCLSVVYVGYRFAVIRSVRFYYNDLGVWAASGILPWNKGVVGVKWRDMDEAVYYQSLFSWLSKSYSIRVGHRFTKNSEIVLTHIARGHQAAGRITTEHQRLLRNNALN